MQLTKLTRGRCAIRAQLGDEAGVVYAFVALALVVLIGMAGLALDGAYAYVKRTQLAKVVDATALAGARNVRFGDDQALRVARAVARSNGFDEEEAAGLGISISRGDDEEVQVTVQGETHVEPVFMKVLGFDRLRIAASAEATVSPVDLVLVIDQSGSMLLGQRPGAPSDDFSGTPWIRLRRAAKQFVGEFRNDTDKLGLVHFSTMAATAVPLQHNFVSRIRGALDDMRPNGDTNSEEALELALNELQSGRTRDSAKKIVVFFTDGRPTAFRHENGQNMGGGDGILTASPRASDSRLDVDDDGESDGPRVLGWYHAPGQDPDDLRMDRFEYANDCRWVRECDTGGTSWNRDDVLDAAHEELLDHAEEIRRTGTVIYAIGLGDPNAEQGDERPDEELLAHIANVDGTGPGPKGAYFFAESPDDLDRVFEIVAVEIQGRLSR
jgi:Mg-chelatase subunit ChlD